MGASELPQNTSIEVYTDKGDQLVDILHDQISDNVCLRVSDEPFSTRRRDTPAYSRLLAVSSTYGYMVAGTPSGLSVFRTADAQEELAKGQSKGTNTAVALSARTEIDLSSHGKVTHVGISADELSVLVATVNGSLLMFSAATLVGQGSSTPTKVIRIGQEIRDMRPNPEYDPAAVAVLTLGGDLLIADIVQGTSKTIVPAGATRITAVCWSRKGKQVVCGDTTATLTQRSPDDGAAKKTIVPPQPDVVPDGAAVVAVEWMATASFFAVYGELPAGAFTPGSGGGGGGDGDSVSGDDDDDDDGYPDAIPTVAYVITRDNKNAPTDWIFVEDPCSSMICPERYPGFHTVCIPDWGKSAQNIVIMAGTSSDATMTIGAAATLAAKDGSADEGSFDWVQWDIDGGMAVMPLSALDADGVEDAFPIGMAMDYTGSRDLPPVEDDGPRVKPVPILWILTTDACLLGYHVRNTFEMRRGVRSAHMVDSVKALPGSASASAFGAKTSAAPASSAALPNAFGAASGFAPSFGGPSAFGGSSAFGKSSTATPTVKAPTTLGSSEKHVFGGGSSGTPFGGFAAAAASDGKSIFDAAPSGPSIFGAPAATESPFGAAKPFGPAKTAAGFGAASAGAGASGADAKAASINAKKSVTFGGETVFNLPKPASTVTSSPSPEPAAPFADLSFGRKLGTAAAKSAFGTLEPAQSDAKSASAVRAEADKKKRDEAAEAQHLEQERLQAEKLRKKKEERKKEEERLAKQQREMEAKAQVLLDQQYIRTCNSVDRELNALAASVKKTDEAITQMRATRLPPIRVDPAVQSIANLTSQMKDMAIDDTELWNRTADVLLEALHVSRDELRDSQRSLSKQLSVLLKAETKCEEATRILGMAASAASPPNSAAGEGGLSPLQRDYQRRLKNAFSLIAKRTVDVELVVNAEADRLQAERDELPRSLRAPSLDSIQRTLSNVSKTLAQKNDELDDLVDLVNDLNLAPPSEQLRKKPRPPPLPFISVAAAAAAEEDSTPACSRQASTPRTAASGVPWSPKDMPFAASPSARRSGGYGLHDEDVLVGKPSASPGASGQPAASPSAAMATTVPLPAHFARTQVRELVPRSIKPHRRASLVADGEAALDGRDDASVAPSTQFSMAASHLLTRWQRAVARDALTRATRTVAVFRAAEVPTARARALPTPMPDLERYVHAFEKLQFVEPEPEPEPPAVPESKPAPEPVQLGFGSFVAPKPTSDEWTCGTCDLLNPTSATACLVCEEPKPGASSAPLQAAGTAPAAPVFGSVGAGFRPSSGFSFGAGADKPASASPFGSLSAAPFGSLPAKPTAATRSFPSFVPPSESAAPEKPAPTGFQPSSGMSFGSLVPPGAEKPKIDLSAKPVLSFSSFVPPGAAAPTSKPDPESEKPAPGDPEWECELCMLMSPSDATQCTVCEAPRLQQRAAAPPAARKPEQADATGEDAGSESGRVAADDDDSVWSDISSDHEQADLTGEDAGSGSDRAVTDDGDSAWSDMSSDHDSAEADAPESDHETGDVVDSDVGADHGPAGPDEAPTGTAASDDVASGNAASETEHPSDDVADVKADSVKDREPVRDVPADADDQSERSGDNVDKVQADVEAVGAKDREAPEPTQDAPAAADGQSELPVDEVADVEIVSVKDREPAQDVPAGADGQSELPSDDVADVKVDAVKDSETSGPVQDVPADGNGQSNHPGDDVADVKADVEVDSVKDPQPAQDVPAAAAASENEHPSDDMADTEVDGAKDREGPESVQDVPAGADEQSDAAIALVSEDAAAAEAGAEVNESTANIADADGGSSPHAEAEPESLPAVQPSASSDNDAHGKSPVSDGHDSDDFVHVSQQPSVSGEGDDSQQDAESVSTPDVIAASSNATPVTPARALSPATAAADVPATDAPADSQATDDSAPPQAFDTAAVLDLIAGIDIAGVVAAGLCATPTVPITSDSGSVGDADEPSSDAQREEVAEIPAALSEAETEEAVEEAQAEAASELSNEDDEAVSEPGSDDLSEAATDELPEAATHELPGDAAENAPSVDSEADSPGGSPRGSMLQKSRTSSGEFVMLSYPRSSRDTTPTPPPASSGADFSMAGLAAGIEAASSDADLPATPEPLGLSSDEERSDVSPTKAYSTSRAALGSAGGSASGADSGAGSFFKAGRLGNFGSSFKPASTSFGASTTAGSELPNAFATQAPPAPLNFGAKLDKPVFGAASMSLFGTQPASRAALPTGFASAAHMSTLGFGAKLDKPASGASSMSSFGTQPASSAAPPTAFASAAHMSTLGFGAKLDKPAFGASSMSSFGAKTSSPGQSSGFGGFASTGRAQSGFGAHAAATQNSFAAISEKSGAAGGGAFGGFAPRDDAGFGRALAEQKPTSWPAARPPIPSDDPIRSIIHADDSDGGANDSGDDSD